MPNSEQS